MDLISILNLVLPFVGSMQEKFPVITVVLGVIALVISVVPAVLNSVIGLWLGVVNLCKALSVIPGLSGLKNLADSLSVSYEKVHSFEEGTLLPLLNRLSSLPLPKLPPKAAAPADGIEVKQ